MDDPIISQGELDSLFSSMEALLDESSTEDQALVTLYDFRQGVKLTPDQRTQIDERLTRLCAVLSHTLGVYMNTEVTLELQTATQGTYDQYITNLPTPIIMATFELSRHTPLATWQIDAPIAYAAIDCMLGGSGQNIEVPSRAMTSVEAGILQRLCAEILDTWKIAWDALSDNPPQIKEVVTSMVRVEEVNSPQEQTYIAFIAANLGGIAGHMNISLPAAALQLLLQRSSTAAVGESSIRPQVLETVSRSRMPLRVTLGEHNRCLRDLVDLEVGSVIDLQHYLDRPFVVNIAGRPKFLAKSGVQRGQLAVELLAPIKE